jgi:chitin synthase
MCTSAFCKTEAVQTMRSLIKQRRRWFLGFITNEVCMLTDWRLWRRYPILVLVRFMQNTIRTTALLFLIMVMALITTTKRIAHLPVGFIAISLGLNWIMMIYFAAKLRRWKIMLYPLMFVLNPFFNWYYMVYGIFTAGQRTWGGPRADAAAADTHTTAQEAIEQAEQTGDDLNIVPESFIPAAERRKEEKTGYGKTEGLARKRGVLQPPNKIAGKFSAPARTPGGWYQHPDDSMASVSILGGSSGLGGKGPLQRRDSIDSSFSAGTGSHSVYMPRRVESLMGDEDKRKYELAQTSQLNHILASPRFVSHPPHGQVYEFSEEQLRQAGFTDTKASLVGPSRPRHQRLASNDSGVSRSSSPEQNMYISQAGSYRTAHQPLMLPPDAFPNTRTARSPLGRASWMRTSTMEEVETEIERVATRAR